MRQTRLEYMEPKIAGPEHFAPFTQNDLTGLKYFGQLQGLLGRLHEHHAHANRILHYDQYLSLLLLYFFNPVVTSVRGRRAADARPTRRDVPRAFPKRCR